MQRAVSGGHRERWDVEGGAQLVFCHLNFYIRGEVKGGEAMGFAAGVKINESIKSAITQVTSGLQEISVLKTA